MLNQITCPNCQTPFNAEIHQVVDVGHDPQLKYELLNGALNVFVCPNCGMSGQMATPLLYHDPEHDLFMVHVPMELDLGPDERQQLIGRLVQEVMNQTPPEERRGYMLQPQEIISYQTFLEKILETEGITQEMIARQRKQGELLQTLATADRDVVDILLEERADEIDETFFAMLRNMIETAQQQGDDDRLLRLINLQARLYRETEVGQELEARQAALRRFQQEVRKAETLTPEMLVKHVVEHSDDPGTVDALVSMGQQAFNYQFFSLLTEEIEKRAKQQDKEGAKQLTQLRQRLLEMRKEMEEESQRILQQANDTLQAILNADDKAAAIQENVGRIDDTFMYVLSAMIAQAEQQGQTQRKQQLQEVQDLIMEEAEKQVPPQIRLINRLLQAETESEQRTILEENQNLVTPELAQMLNALVEEVTSDGQAGQAQEIAGRIRKLQAMVEARM